MTKLENLFDTDGVSAVSEISETIFSMENARVEKILSCNQSSPEGFFYNQEHDECVWLLQGSARLYFKETDKTVSLNRGDGLFIPAGELHRVEKTSENPPCIWIAILGNSTQFNR